MNTLERKVLELIGEDPDSPDVFTDDDEGMTPIREALSDAIQEIVMLTGFHKRQYFLPLREDIAFYRLQLQNGSLGWITDAWSVTQQYRLEQTDVLRLSAHDPRWMIYTGTSDSYFHVGRDVVGIYPKPAADGNVIELTVVEIPSANESSEDRVKLRDSFHYAAVQFAVSEYWATRGDAQESQAHFARYIDALGLTKDYLPLIGESRAVQTRKDPWPQATT